MKIYVAGPFFNVKERTELEKMIGYLNLKYPDAELFIPMDHEIKNGQDLPNCIWSKKVFDMDVKAIDDCDFVVALYMGHYSDTGTVWETGYAYAKGIPVILYIPEDNKEDMSLMVLNSCTSILNAKDIYMEKYNQK